MKEQAFEQLLKTLANEPKAEAPASLWFKVANKLAAPLDSEKVVFNPARVFAIRFAMVALLFVNAGAVAHYLTKPVVANSKSEIDQSIWMDIYSQ